MTPSSFERNGGSVVADEIELEDVDAPKRAVAGLWCLGLVVGVVLVEYELRHVLDLAAGAREQVDAAAVLDVVEQHAVGIAQLLVAVLARAGVVEAAVLAELVVVAVLLADGRAPEEEDVGR